MNDYKKIVRKLVKKSFPKLRKRKIIVKEVPKIFPFLSFAQKGVEKYYIFMNKRRKIAPLESLKGQLAHELCHIELDHLNKTLIMDLIHNFRKFLSTLFNTKFSREIEAEIDRETIKRGFGRELYSQGIDWQKSFSQKFVNALYARGYLTPKEIKAYAIKKGKWDNSK